MSDERRAAPYRREPTIIDGQATELRPAGTGETAPATVEPTPQDEEPGTAIEPVAATGLDGAVAADGPSGHAESSTGTSGDPTEFAPPLDPIETTQPHREDPTPPSAPDASSSSRSDRDPPARSAGAGTIAGAGLLGGLAGAALALAAGYLWQPADSMEPRLAALEARPRAAPAADLQGALERRLAAAETASKAAADGLAATRADAEAARRAVADLANRPATAEASPATRQALDAASGRLTALETATQRNGAAIGEVGAKADAQAVRIGALSGDLAKMSPAALDAAIRLVLAGEVAGALRAGLPVGPALAALERHGATPAAIAAAKPFASSAPPSAAALAAEFRPIAEGLRSEPAAPDAGFADRLRRMADRVVTVRVVGDGTGSDMPARVGRIEAALARGALAEAAAALDALPDSARATTATFAGRLKGRVSAEEAARGIVADAIATLDQPAR